MLPPSLHRPSDDRVPNFYSTEFMITFLKQRPWIWVLIAFVVLFTAWGSFFAIAIKNQPEKIPLEHLSPKSSEDAEDVGGES